MNSFYMGYKREYCTFKVSIEPMHSSKTHNYKGIRSTSDYYSWKMICDAVFWNPVPNTIDWYSSMNKEDSYVMIRLKQVLQSGLKIIRINKNNKLPIKGNKNMQSV